MRCSIELDREVLPAERTDKVVLKISLLAPEAPERRRPPINLAVVLDRSGSMAKDKIAKAREAAIEAVRRLDARDRFSLVTYADQAITVIPAQQPLEVERIIEQIRAIRPQGRTALFGGVSRGSAELNKFGDGAWVNRMILLSDGLANVGPSSPADLGRLGTALLEGGVSVTTVGVGLDYNEDLMTRLAEKSDGNTYFVEASDDLPRIFAGELGELMNVAARNVDIELRCAPGVRPLRVIGRDGRIRGDRVHVALNQVYGGREKYILVETEVTGDADGAARSIADLSCMYDDALGGERRRVDAAARALFSADTAAVTESANDSVQNALGWNEAALVKDEAVRNADAGDLKAAIDVLNDESRELRQRGRLYHVPGLEEQARDLENAARVLQEDRRMNKKTRKNLRAESWQGRSQQSYK